MNKVITIGREFGSGGREIGLWLAEKLNIPFYDKELITNAAKEGVLAAEVMEKYEESVMRGHTFSPNSRGLYAYYQKPITDQIYLAQSKIIRELADAGPSVIVGRCADYVLEGNSIKIFVHADLTSRIQRKIDKDIGVPAKAMQRHILSVDKKRKKYYEYYTDRRWGMMEHYHLCIDTTKIGIDGCVETIISYVKHFI